MSTRSQLMFWDFVGQLPDKSVGYEELLKASEGAFYRHSDGYPHGDFGVIADLWKTVWRDKPEHMTGSAKPMYQVANGGTDLGAMILADWKEGPYNVYLDHGLHGDLEWVYAVWMQTFEHGDGVKTSEVMVRVLKNDWDKGWAFDFEGTLAEAYRHYVADDGNAE